MDATTGPATGDLREYLAVVRRRKWTIILSALVVIGTALSLSYRQTPVYSASTKVLVEPIASDPLSLTPLMPVVLDTQEQVVASEPVAVMVREELDEELSVDQLLAGLGVAGLTETQVLQITYRSPDPEFARDAARAFAESYLTYRNEQGLEETELDERIIDGRIRSANTQLENVEAELQRARESNDETLVLNLENQRSVLIARLGLLQQRLDDLRTATVARGNTGEIIESAQVPTAPVSPNHKLNAVLGTFLGLALGIALAFLRERLDNRFRGREDLEKATGTPVLGAVPRFGTAKSDLPSRLIASNDPKSIASESYRSLRTNLQFITSQRQIRSVLVTSSSAGEGKSATTANLATVLAQAGKRVILLSTDLRRPTLGGYFGIYDVEANGITTWLTSDATDPSPILHRVGLPNLRVIPSGPVPPNPAELLASSRFRNLVAALEKSADVVLLDSPPVLAVADATVLASVVGGCLLVVDATKTHRTATLQAKGDLEKVGGRVIGTVINSYDRSDSPYYYGSYRYDGAKEPTRNGAGRGRRSGRTSKRRARAS